MPHRLEVPAAPAASRLGLLRVSAAVELAVQFAHSASSPGADTWACSCWARWRLPRHHQRGRAARWPPTVAAPLTFPQLPVSSRPCPASRARPRLPVPSVCLPFCWQSGQRGTWGQPKRRPEAEAGASKAPGERRRSQPRRGDPKARMACDQRVRGRGCRSLGGGTDPSGLVAFLGSRVCHRICRRGRRGPWLCGVGRFSHRPGPGGWADVGVHAPGSWARPLRSRCRGAFLPVPASWDSSVPWLVASLPVSASIVTGPVPVRLSPGSPFLVRNRHWVRATPV